MKFISQQKVEAETIFYFVFIGFLQNCFDFWVKVSILILQGVRGGEEKYEWRNQYVGAAASGWTGGKWWQGQADV